MHKITLKSGICRIPWSSNDSKYPPAVPVALRLLAPQRGLTATVRSKSKNKSKSLVPLRSLSRTGNFRENILPEFSKFCCHPARSGGSPTSY